MNKMRLIKTLDEECIRDLLTGDELRLYLLLVAASNRNGQGTLPSGIITAALGMRFMGRRYAKSLKGLEEQRLIEVRSPQPAGCGNSNYSLAYRLRSGAPRLTSCPPSTKGKNAENQRLISRNESN